MATGTSVRYASALLVCVVSAALGAAAERPAVVSAADFARPDSPTAGLQEAIGALPKEGGVVSIPPGTYVLRQALVLRSHVTLRGAGSTTILTRGKQAHTKLAKPARKGETAIEVETTDGFRPGDEVALMDDPMHGWYMAHGIVLGIEECEKSDHNVVAANLCEGNAQGGIAIVGKNTQATGNVGTLARAQGK
ncbi:MAG: hypothetical protein FJ291_14920 [Planctomycetes bacterium]|nr:hypothetical protein [Planctomycetota bacterium]